MIIGLDLDQTITDLPAFFSLVTTALVEAGHEVHIITYREPDTLEEVRAELERLGIRYSSLHLPSTPCPASEWKAALARELRLDIMIDDSPEVLARMPPAVRRLWLCDSDVFDLDTCVRALRHKLDGPQRATRAPEG